CDVRLHARVHEGVAIGDYVTLGDQSVIYPGVRISQYKEVEYGAQIHESLIWESRASNRVFAKDGVVGLVNVDLTPEVAVRLGAALGTALKRGARGGAARAAVERGARGGGERGELPRLSHDQARADLGAELDGRVGRRPPHA